MGEFYTPSHTRPHGRYAHGGRLRSILAVDFEMAVGCDLESSIVVEDHFALSQRTDDGENKQLYNTTSILYSENKFSWEGSLDELKAFVQHELKLRGKWTSPGGEVKLFYQFTGVNVSVKWLGRKKRKLTISSDDINKTLIETMKIIAAKSKNINTHKKLSEVCACPKCVPG